MDMFKFTRVSEVSEAVQMGAKSATAQQGAQIRFVAGGTTLLDLMKLNVERPSQVIDITRLPLDTIQVLPDGRLQIGAVARNSDLAHHPIIQQKYSVLSQALLSGASAQLRNMATTGGNLLQRTRCMYFRNDAFACNKRSPGTGCSAIDGDNRTMAILGTSPDCIATHPSDMSVALAALDATIHIEGVKGQRAVPISRFFLLPGNTPHNETVMEPGELITHVTLPPALAQSRQAYLKLRDRASYEFALASAAIIVTMSGDRIGYARVALGGVATKPWRSNEAEHVLLNRRAEPNVFRQAADAALRGAILQRQNGFKVELARRCIIHALTLATKNA